MTDRLAEHSPLDVPALRSEDDLYVGPEYPGLTRYRKVAPDGYVQADGIGFQSIRSDWDAKPLPGSDLTHAQEFKQRSPEGVIVQTYTEDGQPIGGQGMAMEPEPVDVEPVHVGVKTRIKRALGFTGARQ